MGLAIVVGILAEVAESEPDELEDARAMFDDVNALLVEHGLPRHVEPERLPPLDTRCSLDSYPYSWLHYLRRAYARRAEDDEWVARPLPEGEDPADDPVLARVTEWMDSHLLCHSDAEGYYVPIDFDPVLFDEQERVPGGMLGSSYRLRDELVLVALALGIKLNGDQLPDSEADAINAEMEDEKGLWIERVVWLSLFEAARLSILHKAAICFA